MSAQRCKKHNVYVHHTSMCHHGIDIVWDHGIDIVWDHGIDIVCMASLNDGYILFMAPKSGQWAVQRHHFLHGPLLDVPVQFMLIVTLSFRGVVMFTFTLYSQPHTS